MLFLYLVIVFLSNQFTYSEDVSPTTNLQLAEGEKKMSEKILDILEHFQQPDPVGLPVASVPDPFSIPDTKLNGPIGSTLILINNLVYGISKFRIIHIIVEVKDMKVQAVMTIDKLQARGNYTMKYWGTTSQGPYTVDIYGLKVQAMAKLGVERDGRLQAQDIHIELGFSTIAVDLKDLGFMRNMLQGFIANFGPFMFETMKPYLLKEAYTKVKTEINNKLNEVAGDMQFPNSISPLDMIIAYGRKLIRANKWDPYNVKDYTDSAGIFSISLTNTWLIGASSFHRVGNITIRLENNTAIADFEIGTQKVEGMTQWEIMTLSGVMSITGTASFSVEYITGKFIIVQPLDTRKRMECRDLDLEVGNIQVRCNGAGTLDYVIEAVVNILPNLLRLQIIKGLEGPIKGLIQQELNKVNTEEIIKQELYRVDEMQANGFKLSAQLKTHTDPDQRYDEDEFFSF